MQRTILCYGDSNTWGYVPNTYKSNILQRYSRNERWTGILQNLLGNKYYIVEEGLNGRTTNLNYHIPPDRNGKTYLPSCLYSHAPIDLVILALGGNDLKACFNRTAEDIRDGLEDLINVIQASSYGQELKCAPQILILPPPKITSVCQELIDENGVAIFEEAIKKSEQLSKLYFELAKIKECFFLDTTQNIFPSNIDGLHYDAIAHKQLAQLIYEKIKNIYEQSIQD